MHWYIIAVACAFFVVVLLVYRRRLRERRAFQQVKAEWEKEFYQRMVRVPAVAVPVDDEGIEPISYKPLGNLSDKVVKRRYSHVVMRKIRRHLKKWGYIWLILILALIAFIAFCLALVGAGEGKPGCPITIQNFEYSLNVATKHQCEDLVREWIQLIYP
jgi:hypothetical protein